MHESSLRRATQLAANSFAVEAPDWRDTAHLLLATTSSGCANRSQCRMMQRDVVEEASVLELFVCFPCSPKIRPYASTIRT